MGMKCPSTRGSAPFLLHLLRPEAPAPLASLGLIEMQILENQQRPSQRGTPQHGNYVLMSPLCGSKWSLMLLNLILNCGFQTSLYIRICSLAFKGQILELDTQRLRFVCCQWDLRICILYFSRRGASIPFYHFPPHNGSDGVLLDL